MDSRHLESVRVPSASSHFVEVLLFGNTIGNKQDDLEV